MTSPETKINLFKTKMLSATSFEVAVYEEAIYMVENDVNTDKVQSWVDNVLCLFHNKPKPLSEKEKTAKINKSIKKEERETIFKTLNNDLKVLFDEYGLLLIGFLCYDDVTSLHYDMWVKMIESKGYKVTDLGDGAYEPYVTKKEIDINFINRFKEIKQKLSDFTSVSKKNLIDYHTFLDTSFFEKVNELIK